MEEHTLSIQINSIDQTSLHVQNLSPPIMIPREAKQVRVYVQQADIWNTVPNVTQERGNSIGLLKNATSINDPIGANIVTLPDGNYGIADVSARISEALPSLPVPFLPDDVTIFGDFATNRVGITCAQANTLIDFSVANSLAVLLGFDVTVNNGRRLTTVANETIFGENVAQFNVINSFVVKCADLVGRGIRLNDDWKGVAAKVPITSSPGSLVSFQPFHPIKLDAGHLRGVRLNQITTSIGDEFGNDVNTGGEDFTVLWVIEYSTVMEDI